MKEVAGVVAAYGCALAIALGFWAAVIAIAVVVVKHVWAAS